MAETERSTTNGGDGWMPALEIPDDAKMDHESRAGFHVQSGAGTIEVGVHAWSIDPLAEVCCGGTWPALLAAGLVAPDWFIEDRQSWCVVFINGSPQVRSGGRGRPKGRYVRLVRRSKGGDFYVRWEVTPVESARYRVRLEELWRRSGKARDETDSSKTAVTAWPPSLAHSYLQDKLGEALAWWKERTGETGYHYTDDSLHRIDLAIEALRRAVADGNMEEQPRLRCHDYERRGNVICWPGRGKVAPVDPIEVNGGPGR